MDSVSKTKPLALANAFAFGLSFNEHPDYSCLSLAFCRGSRWCLGTQLVGPIPSPPAIFWRAGPFGHFLFYRSWKVVGSECGPDSREHAHLLVKRSFGLLAHAGTESCPFSGLHSARERLLKCSFLWNWAILGEVEQQMENSIQPFIGHMSLLSVGQRTKFAANI